MYLLDISNPSLPQKISERIHTRGIVKGFFYDLSNYILYIAAECGGLEIWNVSNPLLPLKIGSYSPEGLCVGVTKWENYAGIITMNVQPNYHLFRVVDISNPQFPQEISSCIIPDHPFGISVKGNYIYVAADDSGMRVIDVSVPQNPHEVGAWIPPAGIYARDIIIEGNYAYIACGGGVGRLYIVNISNPSNPYTVGYCDLPAIGYGLTKIGNFVLVAVQTAGMTIIDVSSPSNPYIIGNCDTPYGAYKVSASYNLACVADFFSAQLIDITNPQYPQIIGFYNTPHASYSVEVVGDYAYLTSGYSGLRIINVSDVFHPYETGFFDPPGYGGAMSTFVSDVAISGNYAFVALSDTFVIDVSNPSTPQVIGICPALVAPEGVTVKGNYAYVVDFYRLCIIDISTPSNPVQVGFLAGFYWPRRICVFENYAYVADRDSGVHIIDISIPTSPQRISRYNTPGSATDVAIWNNYLFVADGSAGLRIIDVSIPTNPQEIGYYLLPRGIANDVDIIGSHAFVAGSHGVYMLNIDNPSNPQLEGFYEIPSIGGGMTPLMGIKVTEDYSIYVTSFYGGMQIYTPISLKNRENKLLFPSIIGIHQSFINPKKITINLLEKIPSLTLSIYTQSGQRKGTYSLQIGENKISLDFLPAGTYFICLEIKERKNLTKFKLIKF